MGKISEATLRTTLKGTENIPITDTDLPKGRTTAANLKTFVTPDLSGYATNEDLDAKADVAGDEFTGPIGSPQVTITRPSEGAMAAILANSRDINFRTMNAGVDSMTFNVQYATPLKITEAGIYENNVLLEDKYAKIEDIPVVTGFITKTDADGYYQPKGEYATQDDVDAKQDTLVSGTNIKTINSQSLLGQGNIEITVEGGGITDAPSDGKMYGRKNAQWSEVVIPDTSDMLTKTEASNTYQVKGDYLTAVPDEYVTETELSAKSYATTTQLDTKLDTETYNSNKATFATKEEIADMATKTWVGEQGYLTEHQDISTLATKQEVTEGLATKQDKGNYLTVETAQSTYQPIGDYATKSELANKADKTELANKQDTLVSGTNIKTINGETILGSGNIEVEGEPTAIVDHGTNDTIFELTPNVLHKWDEVASLTLTLGAETPNIVNEFMIQFTSGATATQLSLPETVKWLNTPEIAANMVYQVSIVNNLAVMGGWSNE